MESSAKSNQTLDVGVEIRQAHLNDRLDFWIKIILIVTGGVFEQTHHAATKIHVAIGVTVVAVGTSLPEVATTMVAAIRREHDIAVANAVGSNIFNLLGVLGATALISPLSFDQSLYEFEMVALALSSLILVPMVVIHSPSLVDRREGGLLLIGYVVFMVLVVVRA